MKLFKRPSFITIIVILGIIVIVQGVSKDYSIQTSPTKRTTQQPEYSDAFKLASLEIGHNNPNQNLVSNFDSLLKQLAQKCTSETENQIADYIYKTQTMIEDKGGNITLLEAATSINGSIPDEAVGVVTCAEIAAAFVTLYGS